LWFLCKTYGKFPDELDLDKLNPVMLAWMQHSWAEDYQDSWKLLENNSYLTASFMNPEGVKQAMGSDSETMVSSDEDFEASSRLVKEMSDEIERERARLTPRRRKRKKING
jgi:hypothetical protein